MTQAAALKARTAHGYGHRVHLADRTLHAFPTAAVLCGITQVPALVAIKVQRLHVLAEAALDGQLDAARLRTLPPDYALAELRTLPGIGPSPSNSPSSGEQGAPSAPRHEPRVHRAVATAYGLDAAAATDVARLFRSADQWRLCRSWVATLLRIRAQDTTQPGTRATVHQLPAGAGTLRARPGASDSKAVGLGPTGESVSTVAVFRLRA
ncbi:hypothetical protein [Streptomyces sp. NPDC050264]|uniref:hypothetical protein n=1 Tax=Streptomyces sp. NPDC050264 TaxID=3155038 RepID=UPI0034315E4E